MINIKKGFTPHLLEGKKERISSKPLKKGEGFTLIELMVVISIIGLISSIVLVSVKSAREKAKTTAVIHFASQVHHALGSEAVGIWDFDDQANPTRDYSGYNNNGTINGAVFKCASADRNNTASGQGCSLEFDGLDDYVEISDASILKPTKGITIVMWLYLKEDPNCSPPLNAYRSILRKGSRTDITLEWDRRLNFTFYYKPFGGADIKGRRYTTGVPRSSLPNPLTDPQNPADVLPIQEWTFVTYTYNPLTLKAEIYLNGRIPPNRYYMVGPPPEEQGEMAYEDFPIRINYFATGACVVGPGNFPGKIDNVRIYGQALSEAQIKQLYAEGAARHGLLAQE